MTKASICGCDVEIYPYVDAFVVQGSEIGDSIVIEDSTLVAAYHTDRGARTAFFNGAGDLSEPEATFGLYLSDVHLIVKGAHVTLKGFDCAVAAGGDTSIHLMEGSDLSLNAARAALLLYSFQPTPIVCDGETKFRQIELFAESQPSARVEAYLASYDEERAAMLSMLDLKFIAAAPAGKSVAVTGDADGGRAEALAEGVERVQSIGTVWGAPRFGNHFSVAQNHDAVDAIEFLVELFNRFRAGV